MEHLEEVIKANRPHLTVSSVNTYKRCLKSLFKAIWGETEFNHKLFFADHVKVLKHLQNIPYNVRKTLLSAIVCISKNEKKPIINAYHSLMMEDADKYNKEQKENKMTEHQKENWMSWGDIIQKRDKLSAYVKSIYADPHPDNDELNELQRFVIVCCYTMIAPRRAKDFTDMKIRDYDEKKDNWYEDGTFHFNQYKTSRFYGHQSVTIPKQLNTILEVWIKKLPKDQEYLFTDKKGKQLTSTSIGKILISVFKKHVSINLLRHAYITDSLGSKIQELEKEAKAMGQSVEQQKLYVKKADP